MGIPNESNAEGDTGADERAEGLRLAHAEDRADPRRESDELVGDGWGQGGMREGDPDELR